ncbi:PREDICTED: uncharacterized protein LOC109230957 [Nicotiana attenuata]|uniref:DUF7780 domain-containing protein n=1 Tax=Nicotiana attenuata TaxID=49451 RepID=A0A1J6IVX4_NICAT|nr:PREDICTED: uncharacterized protein LOC109230957 [Nicotiana attenuata]OIS99288.1 hypothetical protein A4A49_05253 [Nicotiana attenuata]
MCERESNLGMGFTAKTKENNNINTHSNNTNNSSESWAMGFLFIFFPEEEDNNNKILNKKPNNFSFSSSSSPSFKSINAILKRSNSTQLLSKAQSTISICALLIFITFLLFTLSTFEPTSPHHFTSRKQLSSSYLNPRKKPSKLFFPHALQGMGSLYRRGTRAMNDIIIAHVVESVTVNELKSFLKLIHRSSVTSKSDILLIFRYKSSSFDNAIVEENNSFLKLIHGYCKEKDIYTSTTFDPTQFVISSKKENSSGEPIWGRKIRSSNEENRNNGTESTRLSYGSIVSFDVDELDPENSLSGFLDHVPLNLRRWACYPMLLGRIRRNYKHIMLVDVKEYLVLGDPLSQLKNRSPETVMLTTIAHKKKNSEKKLVDSGIVFGGARGIRRLSNAMVTEIARVAIQHKKKNSVSESGLFNQLVGNEFMLKNVNLINSGESIHELSSLTGLNSKSGFNSLSIVSKFPIVRRGNSNLDINSVFKKYLCSSPLDSIAYSDC